MRNLQDEKVYVYDFDKKLKRIKLKTRKRKDL